MVGSELVVCCVTCDRQLVAQLGKAGTTGFSRKWFRRKKPRKSSVEPWLIRWFSWVSQPERVKKKHHGWPPILILVDDENGQPWWKCEIDPYYSWVLTLINIINHNQPFFLPGVARSHRNQPLLPGLQITKCSKSNPHHDIQLEHNPIRWLYLG